MPKRKRKTKKYWFYLGLFGVLISAPNATVIKYSLSGIDPFLFNSLRFLLIALLTTPALILSFNKFKKSNISYAFKSGLFMSFTVMTYVLAINLGQASYVSIITLLTPIIFILLSAKMTGEKISQKSIAGITIAAIGAAVIVILPISIAQDGQVVFNPLVVFLALSNTVLFPLAIINLKKANEKGISMMSLMAVSSWMVFVVNAMFFVSTGKHYASLNKPAIFGIVYSGIVVAFIGRVINVVSYEHIGSAVTSALGYLDVFISILLPVLILNEKLSPEMVIGGILILCGVYVVEHHKSAHHKYHHIFHKH